MTNGPCITDGETTAVPSPSRVNAEIAELRASLRFQSAQLAALATKAAQLDQIQRELAAKNERLDQLATKLGQQAAAIARLDAQSRELNPCAASTPRRASRRAMLGQAATLAGLGLITNLGRTEAQTNPPTKGAKSPTVNGSNFILGNRDTAANAFNPGLSLNFGSEAKDATLIENAQIAIPNTVVLWSDNYPGTSRSVIPANAKLSLFGSNNFAATTGSSQVGVYGKSTNGIGVQGEGLWPVVIKPNGAVSLNPPPNGDGAAGTPNDAPVGSMFLRSAPNSGAPAFLAGDDTLWFNFNPSGIGILGQPQANWRRVATNFMQGVFVGLAAPVRVLDTRPNGGGATTTGFDGAGAPIVAGQVPAGAMPTYKVAGKTFAGTAIPVDVKALLGVLSIVRGPSGGGGFVTIFTAGVTPPNAASVIPNPTSPFIASSSAFTQLGSGNFQINNVGAPSDIIFDLNGYWY